MRDKNDAQPIKDSDIKEVLAISRELRKTTGNYSITIIIRAGILKFIEVVQSKAAPKDKEG